MNVNLIERQTPDELTGLRDSGALEMAVSLAKKYLGTNSIHQLRDKPQFF